MERSALAVQLQKIMKLINMLRDTGLEKHISLPKIVVVGSQSSGKSSLIEQIVGLDFLPRGAGIVTRRPLQLRMNNTPGLASSYAEFDQVVDHQGKKRKFDHFEEVRKTIQEITVKVCGHKKIIQDIPIILNIYSSNCPTLTIIDLPGIALIPHDNSPTDIHTLTRQLIFKYTSEPRAIILCVIPANQDLSNCQVLQMAMKIDPAGQRSLGCLTKIDIMDRGTDAVQILKNEEIYLRYGYVGVKNRCQLDIINNVPVSEGLKSQKQFFAKSPIYSRLPSQLFSTESLIKKLTKILYQQIKKSIPQILQQIKTKKHQIKQDITKLGPSICTTQEEVLNYAWKSVANFMEIFTNSINGVKNVNYNADPVSSQIRAQLSNLYKQEYEESATGHLSDRQIMYAMENYSGGSTMLGLPAVDAFLAVVNPLLKKLQAPACAASNNVHAMLDSEACSIISHTLIQKFPQFNQKFRQLIKRVLQKNRKQLQTYLNLLLQAQISYLFTNDKSFIYGDFNSKQDQQKKTKYPLVHQFRKRIDAYYKIVVKNLRDLFPKQIINFMLIKCTKEIQFQSYQFTNDIDRIKQWLKQPETVKQNRVNLYQSLKILQESEKQILMDIGLRQSSQRKIVVEKVKKPKQDSLSLWWRQKQQRHPTKIEENIFIGMDSSISNEKQMIKEGYSRKANPLMFPNIKAASNAQSVSKSPQQKGEIILKPKIENKQQQKKNEPVTRPQRTQRPTEQAFKLLFGMNANPNRKTNN